MGVCYASETLISILRRVEPPYNVNELTQQKAIELLKIKDLASKEIKTILEARNALASELKTIPFVANVYPSDANFLLVKVDNATQRYNQLISKGIVIRNRTTQFGCENCLRFTVGAPNENKILIDTLKSI